MILSQKRNQEILDHALGFIGPVPMTDIANFHEAAAALIGLDPDVLGPCDDGLEVAVILLPDPHFATEAVKPALLLRLQSGLTDTTGLGPRKRLKQNQKTKNNPMIHDIFLYSTEAVDFTQ